MMVWDWVGVVIRLRGKGEKKGSACVCLDVGRSVVKIFECAWV